MAVSLEDAVRDHPDEAERAIALIQVGAADPFNLAGILAAARLIREEPAGFVIRTLEGKNLLPTFRQALVALGLSGLDDAPRDAMPAALDKEAPTASGLPQLEPLTDPPPLAATNFSDDLAGFIERAQGFKCRILVDGRPAGSGCMIGPSLLLTAWHVVSDQATKARLSRVEVEFLPGGTPVAAAEEPVALSPCTDEELEGRLPQDDACYDDRNDFAVLRLTRAMGMNRGYIDLPEDGPGITAGSAIVIPHFPEGKNVGQTFGCVRRFNGLTARWLHTGGTTEGSSGAPCFDTSYRLAGMHQGRWFSQGRMVPVARVLPLLREAVRSDKTPIVPWSLDGTMDTALVIGRDVFFEVMQAAGRAQTRVRGVFVRRLGQDDAGMELAATMQMAQWLLDRIPREAIRIRMDADSYASDFFEGLSKKLHTVGLDVAPPNLPAGVRPGDTTLEAASKAEGEAFATAVDQAVGEARLLWILLDNPSDGLSQTTRFRLEGFVAAVLRRPRLRLVVTGFETIGFASAELETILVEERFGEPVLAAEWLGGITAGDVANVFERAYSALGRPIERSQADRLSGDVLQGLANVNGRYPRAVQPEVAARVKARLRDGSPSGGGGE